MARYLFLCFPCYCCSLILGAIITFPEVKLGASPEKQQLPDTFFHAYTAGGAGGMLSSDGLSLEGLSLEGLSLDGINPDGLSPDDLSPYGLSPVGLSPDGLSPDGLSLDGLSPDGLSPSIWS